MYIREVFVLEREVFVLEREVFVLEREVFILEREVFILEREVFNLEREAFVLEGEAFILERERERFRIREIGVCMLSCLTFLCHFMQQCADADLADKNVFKTVARTSITNVQVTPPLLATLKHYKWKRVAIIVQTKKDWQMLNKYISKALAAPEYNITVAHVDEIDVDLENAAVNNELMLAPLKNSIKGLPQHARSKRFQCGMLHEVFSEFVLLLKALEYMAKNAQVVPG